MSKTIFSSFVLNKIKIDLDWFELLKIKKNFWNKKKEVLFFGLNKTKKNVKRIKLSINQKKKRTKIKYSKNSKKIKY